MMTDTTFQEVIDRYERHGWEVRMIDRMALRATVRASADTQVVAHSDASVRAPARMPACRRLWIDSQGLAQETDVPC